jgi:hypothetical protein
LRDIVVTEYGIADLRGKNDREVIEAMLSIADSRFQAGLIREAQAAGKLPADYQLPEHCRQNTPGRLQVLAVGHEGCFPEFPLGCDFDAVEQQLLAALRWLKAKAQPRYYLELGRRVVSEADAAGREPHLARMGLQQPANLRQRLARSLLLAALAATGQ